MMKSVGIGGKRGCEKSEGREDKRKGRRERDIEVVFVKGEANKGIGERMEAE